MINPAARQNRHATATLVLLPGLCAMAAASLLLLPVERLIPAGSGPHAMPVLLMRLATVVQPALLLALGLWLGWRLAPGLGLGVPLLTARAAGKPVWPLLQERLPAIAAVALLAALLLAVWVRLVVPRLFAGSPLMDFQVPLLTRLAYGGIGEEVMMRWGLLSALAAAGLKLGLGRSRALAVAAVLAALLFGAGHLPLLAAMAQQAPAWAAPAVVLANAVPGLMFGLLFIRHGLEAAMLAHAGAHLLAWLLT
jgi:hypothetical protein